MTDHVYKTIDLYGSSKQGLQHAIELAVAKAGESVRNMRWFQMTEVRGHIDDGKVKYWQVGVRIGFTVGE
ncbi:MAG: dodecin family protein [Gemmatimonadota bacterium]|nr:dodecin family protein [Gemmatimonadota bacterium]